MPGSTSDELRRAFANLTAALGAAGFEKGELVFIDIALIDLADAAEVNSIYAELFPAGRRPARTMVQAWQIVPDPTALAARGITIDELTDAIRAANGATGGSVIEQGEAEVMVRSEGYLREQADFERIPIRAAGGVPVLLQEVARVQRGPTLRRGIAELDGQGEVAGGVVILRSGKNALAAIDAVKARLAALRPGLPPGVEIVPVYDRSGLIREAVRNLSGKLVEEFLVVLVVCALFLWHLRSALVAVVTLPLGVLAAFVVMHQQGISANLLSLGGIAIAIGAMGTPRRPSTTPRGTAARSRIRFAGCRLIQRRRRTTPNTPARNITSARDDAASASSLRQSSTSGPHPRSRRRQ